MKYISNFQNIQKEPHFGVFTFTTVDTSGYDRDETSSREVVEYISFKDEEELKNWIARRHDTESSSTRLKYQVVYIKPLNVSTKIQITLDP